MIDELVTAVVLTSPVRSNPSTDVITATLDSIRHWFPEAKICLMCDGVREEQKDMRDAYREFYYQLILKNVHRGVHFYPYFEHKHQIGLMREFMKVCETPLIFFSEHDTPLVRDEPIPMTGLGRALMNGHFDFVRFLPEAHIHPEHEHLMCGQMFIEDTIIRLRKTIQFSARPHLATKVFYAKALSMFTPCARCFIEDKMHSICQSDPWEEWRMTIYEPEGNAKRSFHLDGRAGASKFDESQVF